VGFSMPSPEDIRRLSAAVTVHNLAANPPPPDRGIWIRIPTEVLRAKGSEDPDPEPVSEPAVEGTSALAVRQPDHPTASRATAVFRLRGHMRDIGFDGQMVSVRELQGFRIYAELFSRPHTRISAVEIRAGIAGVEPAMFAGSTGQTVTRSALADLRRQYEELSEELAEAELNHDDGKTRKLQEELTVLADHVRRAVGKDGEPRTVSDAERARVAVAKSLTRARRLLSQQHPALLKHINRTVQTGNVLCYQPEVSMNWDVRS